MKKYYSLIIIVLLFSFYTGCKKDQESEKPKIPTYTNGEGIIGESGGTITIEDATSPINGVKLIIPEGALNTEKTISITTAPQNIKFPGDTTQQLIQFLPEGLTFQKPITIEIPYTGNNTTNLGIFYYDPENELISEIETSNIDKVNKNISGFTDHFSYYTAWDKSVAITFNMINTSTNKIGVRLDIYGMQNNETGLNYIPTTRKNYNQTGNNSALQVLLDIDNSFIYSVFRVELYEDALIGNTSVASTGFEINREMSNGINFYAQIFKQNESSMLFESGALAKEDIGNDFNNLGRWYSGEPLLFVFENFTPNPDKKYFVKAGWALSKERTYLGNDNYTNIYFFNNKPDKQKPNEMSQIILDDIDFNSNFVWDEFEVWGNEFSPVCEFEASHIIAETGQTIYFSDLSTNEPTAWQWNFGDGNTSTLKNPEHAYSESGSYNVSLAVSNEYGTDSQTKSNYISVEAGNWGEPCPGTPTVTDVDGNIYNTVQVGNQCWMKENLKTGTTVSFANQTPNGITEKFAYDNYAPFIDTYGGLYQWDEMMNYEIEEGAQGICPDGWHVPTLQEYQQMTELLGGSNIAGAKMKSTSELWYDDNNASNQSGFTALPGGYRDQPNIFEGLYGFTYLWTSTLYPAAQAESIGLGSYSEQAFIEKRNRIYANYVRCIRNQ